MPTAAEWQELMDNCTWTWNEDYYNNGIMVTSTVPGYESAKIFLPVVGWREDNKLNEINPVVEEIGRLGMFDILENLQTHPVEVVYEKVINY